MRRICILLLLFTITNLFSLNITLKNGKTLSGKLILLKRNYYYIFADQTLLMIENRIVGILSNSMNWPAFLSESSGIEAVSRLPLLFFAAFAIISKCQIRSFCFTFFDIFESVIIIYPNFKFLF